MQKHTKNYMDAMGFSVVDFIPCEICGARGVDIHHVEPKGMGGSKTKDHIENLICLCRRCHDKAHDQIITKRKLKQIIKKRCKR